jgi:hypothetical protein
MNKTEEIQAILLGFVGFLLDRLSATADIPRSRAFA